MVESGRAWRSARTTAGVTLRARPLSNAAKAVPMRRGCNTRMTPSQGNGIFLSRHVNYDWNRSNVSNTRPDASNAASTSATKRSLSLGAEASSASGSGRSSRRSRSPMANASGSVVSSSLQASGVATVARGLARIQIDDQAIGVEEVVRARGGHVELDRSLVREVGEVLGMAQDGIDREVAILASLARVLLRRRTAPGDGHALDRLWIVVGNVLLEEPRRGEPLGVAAGREGPTPEGRKAAGPDRLVGIGNVGRG